MWRNVKKWLRSAAVYVLIVLGASLLLDYWRRPAWPLDGAHVLVQTVDGKRTTLGALSHSQTAVLYFWGSWCGICRHTSPAVARLSAEGTPVVAVALQSGSDADIAAYLAAQQIRFPVLNDPDGRWSQAWRVQAVPTVVLLRDGQVVHSTTGLSSYWGLRLRLWWADVRR